MDSVNLFDSGESVQSRRSNASDDWSVRGKGVTLSRSVILALYAQSLTMKNEPKDSFGDFVSALGSDRIRSRKMDHAKVYLSTLVQEQWVSSDMPHVVLGTMEWVRGINPSLPLPDLGPTETGRVILTWDKGDRHLEAEILPFGDVELFYRDRDAGTMWSEDIDSSALRADQEAGLRRAIKHFLRP